METVAAVWSPIASVNWAVLSLFETKITYRSLGIETENKMSVSTCDRYSFGLQIQSLFETTSGFGLQNWRPWAFGLKSWYLFESNNIFGLKNR